MPTLGKTVADKTSEVKIILSFWGSRDVLPPGEDQGSGVPGRRKQTPAGAIDQRSLYS